MGDTTFLATIQWPPMESMDYIEPDVSENYKYAYRSTTQAQENNLHNSHNSSNQCKNNHNREHNEEKQYNQSNHLCHHKNHWAPLQKLFHYDHHLVWSRFLYNHLDYLVLLQKHHLQKHHLLHHHHNQHDHNLLLDHNNIDLLESTTIDLDHNKPVTSYNNLLTWTTTQGLTTTTATT